MNAITVSETTETITIEDVTAVPKTSLMHDMQEIPLSRLVASKQNVRRAQQWRLTDRHVSVSHEGPGSSCLLR